MSSSHPGGGVYAASDAGPLVSAVANGDSNTRVDAPCYAGVQFNATTEIEYEYTAAGAASVSQGPWLDRGSPSDVWITRIVTAGSWNSIDPGTGRHQLSTTRSFRVVRSSIGFQTVTGYFQFHDAASGGNLLQQTSSAVYSAEFDTLIGPCPLCCFTPDTPVTMASGMQMPIGKVKVGDKIMTLDGPEEVTEVLIREKRAMYRIDFSDGRHINASDDHPFEVFGKGPASINPVIEYKDLGVPRVLRVGDSVITDDDAKSIYVVRLTRINYPGPVYTFANQKFFANGMLVY